MYPNPLKQKVKAGDLVLGSVLPALSNYIATLTCQTGIDFMWVDMEHAYRTLDPDYVTPNVVEQFRRMAELEGFIPK